MAGEKEQMGEMDDLDETNLRATPSRHYKSGKTFAVAREKIIRLASRNLNSIKARALNSASKRKVSITLPKLSCLEGEEE